MKKFLVLTISIIFTISSAIAEPIVELAAPRMQAPRVMSDNGKTLTPKASATKTSVKKHKKVKKHKIRKPKPPVLNYNRVSKLIENGYYDDADYQIRLVMSKNPKDTNAPILWVVSQAKQGNLDAAQNKFNNLVKTNPKNSDLFYAKGIIDYKRAQSSNLAYKANAQTLIDNAMNDFQKAIVLDKNNANAYNAAGVVAFNKGDKTNAAKYFQKAFALDKTYSIAIDNLGTIDYLAGNYDSANNKFKQALALNSQNSTAMYHLAQVAYKKQDYTTSLKYLGRAVALNPYSAAFYNLRGKNYAALGNDAVALSSFQKSTELKPDFTASYIDIAKIYANRGDNEFAIEALKTALSINPNIKSAKLQLANLLVLTSKYPQAITIYSELGSDSEYKNSALIGLANAYYGQAQISANKTILSSNKELYNALSCINKAIEANNDNLELHLAKLKLTKLTNQPNLTKVELDKIIQSPKNDLMTNLLKGEAYSTLNDNQNAQIAFNNAVKLSKNMNDSLYLAEILIYQKQYDSAQSLLKKILSASANNQQALNGIDYINKNKKLADKYYESAQIFLKQKNYTVAIEYLNRSVLANPNNANVRLILAKLYEKQKDYQDAVANYQAYVGLNPNAKNVKQVSKKIKKLENRL